MQLPDFFKDPELNALRAQMRATELGSFRLAFNVYRFTISDLEHVVADGITLDDPDKVRPLEDKTLTYKDRRVLLHPRNVQAPAGTDLATMRWPAFHPCACSRVRELCAGTEPLVVTAREDGLFQVRLLLGALDREAYERLPVCEACLAEIQYEGFSPAWSVAQRAAAVKRFDIGRFLQRYGRTVVP